MNLLISVLSIMRCFVLLAAIHKISIYVIIFPLKCFLVPVTGCFIEMLVVLAKFQMLNC